MGAPTYAMNRGADETVVKGGGIKRSGNRALFYYGTNGRKTSDWW